MLVSASEGDSHPLAHPLGYVLRLLDLHNKQTLKALEKRNQAIRQTEPFMFYREQLHEQQRNTDAMAKLKVADTETMRLSSAQHSAPMLPVATTTRPIVTAYHWPYDKNDARGLNVPLKDLIERATAQHLKRKRQAVKAISVSTSNYINLRIYGLIEHIAIVENELLDDFSVICHS